MQGVKLCHLMLEISEFCGHGMHLTSCPSRDVEVSVDVFVHQYIFPEHEKIEPAKRNGLCVIDSTFTVAFYLKIDGTKIE